MPGINDTQWWQRGVIYQIYPRSFMDSDGDGIGDLPGIIQRLDYLADTLGVDAIWLSPFYPSPMADFGYDVADYTNIDPLFGDLHDFDELVDKAHRREIRVIIDFVPNHSSDQHPWFIESSSSTRYVANALRIRRVLLRYSSMSAPPLKAVMAAYWIGALVAVKVSLATMDMASPSQLNWGGKEKVPKRHPPAPHHLLRPLLMMVPSG